MLSKGYHLVGRVSGEISVAHPCGSMGEASALVGSSQQSRPQRQYSVRFLSPIVLALDQASLRINLHLHIAREKERRNGFDLGVCERTMKPFAYQRPSIQQNNSIELLTAPL